MEKPSVAFASLETKGVEKGGVHGVFSCQGYVDDVAMVRQGESSSLSWRYSFFFPSLCQVRAELMGQETQLRMRQSLLE